MKWFPIHVRVRLCASDWLKDGIPGLESNAKCECIVTFNAQDFCHVRTSFMAKFNSHEASRSPSKSLWKRYVERISLFFWLWFSDSIFQIWISAPGVILIHGFISGVLDEFWDRCVPISFFFGLSKTPGVRVGWSQLIFVHWSASALPAGDAGRCSLANFCIGSPLAWKVPHFSSLSYLRNPWGAGVGRNICSFLRHCTFINVD